MKSNSKPTKSSSSHLLQSSSIHSGQIQKTRPVGPAPPESQSLKIPVRFPRRSPRVAEKPQISMGNASQSSGTKRKVLVAAPVNFKRSKDSPGKSVEGFEAGRVVKETDVKKSEALDCMKYMLRSGASQIIIVPAAAYVNSESSEAQQDAVGFRSDQDSTHQIINMEVDDMENHQDLNLELKWVMETSTALQRDASFEKSKPDAAINPSNLGTDVQVDAKSNFDFDAESYELASYDLSEQVMTHEPVLNYTLDLPSVNNALQGDVSFEESNPDAEVDPSNLLAEDQVDAKSHYEELEAESDELGCDDLNEQVLTHEPVPNYTLDLSSVNNVPNLSHPDGNVPDFLFYNEVYDEDLGRVVLAWNETPPIMQHGSSEQNRCNQIKLCILISFMVFFILVMANYLIEAVRSMPSY